MKILLIPLVLPRLLFWLRACSYITFHLPVNPLKKYSLFVFFFCEEFLMIDPGKKIFLLSEELFIYFPVIFNLL